MADFGNSQNIDFTVDQKNLYREESVSDLKVASIRQMVPINPDGSDDTSRSPIFMGHSQIMTPEGPLPLQARLAANNISEAFEVFPDAMQKALSEMVQQIQEMQRREQEKKMDDSRIIVPGR
ncbi:MAG: cytoplasmic protein [Desulfobacteraceae bacterium]|jgi:hypothetical protein